MSEPRRPEEADEELFFEREGQEAESLDIDPSEDVFEIVAHEDLESAAQWVPATADDAAPASIYPPRVVASEPKHTARVITAIGAMLLLMAAAWWYTSGGGDEVERPSTPATAPAPLIPPATNGVAAAPPAPSPSLPATPAAGPATDAPARSADVSPAPPPATPRIDSTTAAARPSLPAPVRIERNVEPAAVPPAPVRSIPEPTPPVIPPTPRVEEPAARATPAIAPPVEEAPPVRTVEEPPIVIAPPSPAPIAPPAVAAPRTTAPVVTDRDAVRAVLDRYRAAYGSLNAAAAHQVYPKVDSRALERAFSQLEMQEIDFASCDIDVTGDRASAGCTGVARFVPKVGNKTPRVESRFWTFDFRRAGRDWRIENVQFR